MSVALHDTLPSSDEPYHLVTMLTTSRAVDLFLGDFSRRSRSKNGKSTEDYRRVLYKFADSIPSDQDVSKITSDDTRRFLDNYNRREPGTQGGIYSILNSFLNWLLLQQRIKQNPLFLVPRPKRIAAEDLDVTTVSAVDVRRLFYLAENHTEKLALAIPAYLGPRRNAVAILRLRDYDRAEGRLRFFEKGSKTIWKPVPYGLAQMLEDAIVPAEEVMPVQYLRGNIALPDDYLVPPEGPLSRKGERDDRVIWRVVKRVAKREGINVHVHALRAAFATFYLESDTGDIETLRKLMGHSSGETTRIYLRKLERKAAMENVRTLDWLGNATDPRNVEFAANVFSSSADMGAGGFEPPQDDSAASMRPGTEHRGAR